AASAVGVRMPRDAESADDAPAVQQTIVQPLMAQEVRLLVREVACGHILSREVAVALRGDEAARALPFAAAFILVFAAAFLLRLSCPHHASPSPQFKIVSIPARVRGPICIVGWSPARAARMVSKPSRACGIRLGA